MSEVLLYALIAILALMVVVGVYLAVLLLPKRRKTRKRSAPPPPPPPLLADRSKRVSPLAEIFADQILAGEGSEGLIKEHFSAPRGKCRNCGGKKPRWTPASADRYLQRPQVLAAAIQNAELCAPCLWILAKTAGGGWKVASTAPAPAPKVEPAVVPAALPISPPSKQNGGEKRVWTRIAAAVFVIPMLGLGLQMGLTGLAAAFLLEGAGAFATFIAAAAFTVAGVFVLIAVVLAKVVINR